jgi:hypothetical protein
MLQNNFEIKFFPTLAMGANFVVDGEAYTKIGDLTFRDAVGMERNIDPLFDVKLGKVLEAAKAAQVNTQQPAAATVAAAVETVFGGQSNLSDSDVERIAQRVAAILKENRS